MPDTAVFVSSGQCFWEIVISDKIQNLSTSRGFLQAITLELI